MKKRTDFRLFISECLLLMIIVGVLLAILDYMSMQDKWKYYFGRITNSTEYIPEDEGSEEIISYINKVREHDGSTILIVGDSVCNQLFDGLQEYNSGITIAGTNAAITMTGQYILVREYLENHPDATDIFLLITPGSLWQGLDSKWGYQYAVMPFVETDTLRLLDEDTIDEIESIYGSCFVKREIVEAIDASAVNRKLYFNAVRSRRSSYNLSSFKISEEYVTKICELSRNHNCRFHLYPCPIPESLGYGEEYVGFKREYEHSRLFEVEPGLFADLYCYPDNQSQDGYHLGGDYANQEHYNEIINTVYNNTELLESLVVK